MLLQPNTLQSPHQSLPDKVHLVAAGCITAKFAVTSAGSSLLCAANGATCGLQINTPVACCRFLGLQC